MSASLNAYATTEMVDAMAREVSAPGGADGRVKFEGGYIKLHDRATESFRPIEGDNGTIVTVEEES